MRCWYKVQQKEAKVVSTINHHVMKTYVAVEVQLHAYLGSVLDGGGQFHAPAALYPTPTGASEPVWALWRSYISFFWAHFPILKKKIE
jgi:hypothetical protein